MPPSRLSKKNEFALASWGDLNILEIKDITFWVEYDFNPKIIWRKRGNVKRVEVWRTWISNTSTGQISSQV